MKIVTVASVAGTPREVHCPRGGFVSYRLLLAQDGMGFGLHKTVIPKGGAQHWHYRHHLEACYCISGYGSLTNLATRERHIIKPDTVYVLDNHDDHTFEAIEHTILISVFNPPLAGDEVHDATGAYAAAPEAR